MSAMIGVLVHDEHRGLFHRAAHTTSGADLRWITYQEPSQAPERLRDLVSDTAPDGLLVDRHAAGALTGRLPEELPLTVVDPTATELAMAIAGMRARFPEHNAASVDGFDQNDLHEVTDALELTATAAPHPREASLDELVKHHREALRDGSVAITSHPGVAEALAAEGPVVRIELSPATIRARLSELRLRADTARAEGMRFAAGVFQIRSGHDIEGSRAGLREILLRDETLSGAWVEKHGRRGLVVFAHRALLERATDGWQVVPALEDARLKFDIRAAAGFGVGASVAAGISLAERAVVRAEAEDEPCGFLVQDNGTIIGPIGGGYRPARYTYRDHGAEVERLATEVGLSPTTLSRLAALEHEVHGRPLAPSELAALLGITDPSGRRLIRKLQAADLVSAEGSAHSTRRGRPTRLYRLRLNDTLGPTA